MSDKPRKWFFYCKNLSKSFYYGKNFVMTKKEYIERAKNCILNRIRFHAPVTYDTDIDRRVLFENGIDANYPIFKFDKVLDKKLLKAFLLAKSEEKFNLLLSSNSVKNINEKKLKTLDAIVYSPIFSSARYIEMINKLNINYFSSTNYDLIFKDKFVKLNGEILNPKFDDFELVFDKIEDKVKTDYFEFVLNGTNFFAQFENFSDQEKNVEFELNLPLKKAYYYFKKSKKYVLIENLLTKESFFFNFICKNAKFSFSNVDGLENSVFCCINVKVAFKILPKEKKFVFFNFGNSAFSLNSLEEILALKKLAKQKVCEIFDVKVKTKNHDFDQYFNFNLPKKIWVNWLNFSSDESLENKYIAYRRLFVKGKDEKTIVCFKEIGLLELGIFNGQYYKKILIINSQDKFLKVGRTMFFNLEKITNVSLKSKEPISLSFGN